MRKAKVRSRGRPRKKISRPRGRPRKELAKKLGRPPWNLATDPDRFAVVATRILLDDYKFTERDAARIAIEYFGPSFKSAETIRWKARKVRELGARRMASVSSTSGINSKLWTNERWFRLMQSAIMLSMIWKDKTALDQGITAITVWAELANETAFADSVLVPLVRKGFDLSPRRVKIDEL